MHAYDEDYLPYAKDCLGTMLDYAVNTCGMDARAFYIRFLGCETSRMFALGHPMFVVGMAGSDVAQRVLEKTGWTRELPPFQFNGYTPEYWAGWALAHFQWYSGLSFQTIDLYGLPIEEIIGLYHPLHEADIGKFLDTASRRIRLPENPLKELRKAAGFTQAALAGKSEVPLRLIRAYEQGTVPLAHAEAGTVLRLARALGCEVGKLVTAAN